MRFCNPLIFLHINCILFASYNGWIFIFLLVFCTCMLLHSNTQLGNIRVKGLGSARAAGQHTPSKSTIEIRYLHVGCGILIISAQDWKIDNTLKKNARSKFFANKIIQRHITVFATCIQITCLGLCSRLLMLDWLLACHVTFWKYFWQSHKYWHLHWSFYWSQGFHSLLSGWQNWKHSWIKWLY